MEWPAPGEVHVWSLDLERPESDAGVLSEDELMRAAAFKVEDGRRRFVVTRAALRSVLGGYLGVDPAQLRFGTGAQGKPRLDSDSPLRFNVSHSGKAGLIAVARDTEVGVDVEEIRPRKDLAGVARRVFTQAEREAIDSEDAFYRHWTAKEAFVKATGRGISSLRSFEVVLHAPEGARLVHVGGDPAEAARWTLAPLDTVPPGYAAAVVAEARQATIHPRRFT
jgi:4'-phosphopantetheinyl transferase